MSKVKFAVINYSKFLGDVPALVNEQGIALIYLPASGHITLNRDEYEILRIADAEILGSVPCSWIFHTGNAEVRKV